MTTTTTSNSFTGEDLMRMLTAHIQDTPAARAAADLVIKHLINEHGLTPKILSSSQRHLLHDNMAIDLHDDLISGRRGVDTLYDYISAGVPGWDKESEEEFLFEALIRNPIVTTLIVHNEDDDQFQDNCLMMLEILSDPAVMALHAIRNALVLDDHHRNRYETAASLMYQQLVDTEQADYAKECAQRVKTFIAALPDIEHESDRPR